MRKLTKKKKVTPDDELHDMLQAKLTESIKRVNEEKALRHSRIKLYESVGILCFAALVNVAVFNHNYAASLCLIPDVWAMYKLFRMI